MGKILIIKGANFSSNACTSTTGNPSNPGPIGSLPEGYTQCSYIQSDGSCYLDTGYVYSGGDYTLEATMNCLNDSILGKAPFGVQSAAGARAFCLLYYDTALRYTQGSTSIPNATRASNPGVRDITVNISCQGNAVTGDVSGYSFSFTSAGSVATNLPLFIFVKNHTGTPDDATWYKGQLRRFVLTVDGVEAMNLVPCRNPDNQYGVYDIARGLFIGASGSGSFTGA